MAIIKIGKVKVTPEKAIAYAVSDKVGIAKKDDVKDSIDYVSQDKFSGGIVHKTISKGMNCSIENAPEEWEKIRKHYGKNNKILMFHVKQNFGIEVNPAIANEIGCKLAEELFSDFQGIVSTHSNTLYTHNHIVFNAVSFRTGNKYYDTLNSYKLMRTISDRLCEEYGLPVIDSTKDFKLVKYVGDNGKFRYFEPTDRKSKVRAGEFADVNDYRNTKAYDNHATFKKTNREVIKNDIDNLLPTVESFDELLDKLQGVGYKINSKKVNGDWLAHVAFKAPMHEKFTRDYKIGELYTREKLIERIERNSSQVISLSDNEIAEDNSKDKNQNIPVYDVVDYQYDGIVIEDISEDYRKRKVRDGQGYEQVRRGEIEKIIILDTKKLNLEIDNEYWQSLKVQKEKQEPTLKNKRNQYLLDCINANLKTLHFVENKNIQSFQQINSIISVLYDKRIIAQTELDKIRVMLRSLNENIIIMGKAKDLREQIESQKNVGDYAKYELESDMSLLNSYETILAKRNLSDPVQQEKFATMLNKYNEGFKQLSNSLKVINEQIREYDDCVFTINRVDKDNQQQYSWVVKEYYGIKETQNHDSNKRKQSHDER
ncbi:relaxase/mobilization nuclease domain-containing protein [Desulfosporosinus sp.]|uniref:relaxase/mobilization nuclease domain-containing protein n=1 Tax=Desulfosporosinus sp. TaxID=157907 RepID=UPI002313D0AC|nr:relaxase/mobilization nuclease domain-containing protein [Desulfosporosinus sp.]MDA8222502.1 relaxase/mobilization nuclease domain-containing protein [Desulfitobacterium hafniense]